MEENLARIIIAGIIGGTITFSMLAMAVSRMVTSRRRREIVDSGADRIEERLVRMEQAIDAIATEVERVSENQRSTTRLLSEGKAGHQA